MRTSPDIANSHPPPSAKPFTAMMTGFAIRSIWSVIAWPARAFAAPSEALASAFNSPMSAPAANALLPLPVTTIARTSESASSSRSAAESSSSNAALSALRTCGRFSAITATGPSRSSRMFSNELTGVVIKPLPALAAEPAGEHHAFEQRRRRHHRIFEFVVHDLCDVIRGVQADEIEQLERSHRVAAAELNALVDVLFARKAFVVDANRIQQIRHEQPVDHETGRIFGQDRFLSRSE